MLHVLRPVPGSVYEALRDRSVRVPEHNDCAAEEDDDIVWTDRLLLQVRPRHSRITTGRVTVQEFCRINESLTHGGSQAAEPGAGNGRNENRRTAQSATPT